MRNISGIFILLLSLLSCKEDHRKEIEKTITDIYGEKQSIYQNTHLDTKYSRKLEELVKKSRETEKLDKEKIEKSNSPTDKPRLIEGEIFTSLEEGYSSYKIVKIDADHKQASAIIEFHNENFKETWKDSLILLNENGWKLDNVYYTNKSNLKDDLLHFNNEK